MTHLSERAQALTLAVPGNDLDAYMRAVNAVPVLSAEEEQRLGERLYYDQDLDAARSLVLSHLRFVAHIARSYTGYGLPLGDLVQEGNVGLMKAVKRFDPTKGVRLVSFAVHWIKAEIYDYVVRNWRMVKVATTKAQRKLFFNLRKNRSRLGPMEASEIEQLAEKLQVDEHTVREMETRLVGADVSFDPISDHDDDSRSLSPAEVLAAEGADPGELILKADEAHSRQLQLREALNSLDDRSRNIIQRRWLNDDSKKPTLQMLADEYNVSACLLYTSPSPRDS